MAKHIDHLVWALRDFESRVHQLKGLGFQISPLALHPFGTGNQLLLFERSYIELLTILDESQLPPAKEHEFSFAAFNKEYLQTRQGISMIALATTDAEADYQHFLQAGLECSPPFYFSRLAPLPNGQKTEVAFTICFVRSPQLLDLPFFVCQHHHPEQVFHPGYQQHENRVGAWREISIVLDKPIQHYSFFEKLFPTAQFSEKAGQLYLHTEREHIRLIDLPTYQSLFPFQTSFNQSPFIGHIKWEGFNRGFPSDLSAKSDFSMIKKSGSYYLLPPSQGEPILEFTS
ncbi:MAG: VOC family protein [Bacteroidota bacterium]